MSTTVNDGRSAWTDELTSSVDDTRRRSYDVPAGTAAAVPVEVEQVSWKFHLVEFAKGFGEMSVEFGKGVRDVVKQSILREDSVIMKRFGGPCRKVCLKLRFLNEYLPEDRDPVHAWTVILFVYFIVFLGKFPSSEKISSVLNCYVLSWNSNGTFNFFSFFLASFSISIDLYFHSVSKDLRWSCEV